MKHKRVIPRDLFNEAKLLNNLGHLIILIEEKRINLPLVVEFDGKPFEVQQDYSNGSLFVSNLKIFLGNEEIFFSSRYNDKSKFTLMAKYKDEEFYAFDENGNFMPNFGWKN